MGGSINGGTTNGWFTKEKSDENRWYGAGVALFQDTPIWGFSKIGVPLVIIHFNGIFPYKPSSYGGTSIDGNLHMIKDLTIFGGFPHAEAAVISHASASCGKFPAARPFFLCHHSGVL